MSPWRGLVRRRESSRHRRNQVADVRRGGDFFGAWTCHWHIARRSLVKQEFSGAHHRLRMEAGPHRPIVQHVRDRHQRHALMMRHVRPYDGYLFPFRYPRGGVIQGFVEPISSSRPHLGQSRQSLRGCNRIDHGC